MADIPNAKDIIGRDGDSNQFERFIDFTTSALTRCIEENKQSLVDGSIIRFHFPVLHDRGAFKKLWVEHFPIFLTLLAQRGWLAERDMEASEIELLISIPRGLIGKSETYTNLMEIIKKADTGNG